jgi:hypothetical protein
MTATRAVMNPDALPSMFDNAVILSANVYPKPTYSPTQTISPKMPHNANRAHVNLVIPLM